MSEYQVLARKYRPRKLSELVGQDVLVRTLSNAINQNRIPHAFVLTGIRGVGKTSTARIIARSLLCTGADNNNENPTTEPCGECANCKGIVNDNHVDVIEVDAASRTGVNDIREIIDQVSYAPVMGRYKIYIIDEVHMLSKSAFNALLKTLEEPPSHVKFIFATTEVRKIPVTILSRCMRFDLPRVAASKLIEHFKNVSSKEGVTVDDEALKIISGAAEGSVRDGLSLLDQSIAVAAGEPVTAQKVREMLGLADKDQIFNLVSNILEGNYEEAFNILNDVYSKGNDVMLILKDLLEITHLLTLAKTSEAILRQNYISELERVKSKKILEKTDIGQLTRLWQILNKGLEEARYCPSPLMAAEMVIIRACFAAKLPTTLEIISSIESGDGIDISGSDPNEDGEINLFAEKKTLNNPENTISQAPKPVINNNITSPSAPAARPVASTSANTQSSVALRQESIRTEPLQTAAAKKNELQPVPLDYKALVQLFIAKNENFIAPWLEKVKLLKYDHETGSIQLISPEIPGHFSLNDITKKLMEWTGKRFIISIENEAALPAAAKSINEEKQEELEKRKNEAINSAGVQTILKEFTGSKIVSVTEIFE